jgi:hypothetical protein
MPTLLFLTTMSPSLLSLLVLSTLILLADAATPKCYALNGTELDNTFAPCNTIAKHSGCCAINAPASSAELCLDTGLCMPVNGAYMGTLWQVGCTDPTGKDRACPRLCPDGIYNHPVREEKDS